MFSLARALFFPGSAEDRSSLFVWFIDSMARSDSSEACASAVWLYAFADRPRSPCGGGALQRSPGSRACCFSACAGSSTTQDRLLARVYRETAVLPSSNQERVGVLVLRFSKLNSPAHRYPLSTLQAASRDATCKTEGQDGVAGSFLVGLFHSLQHAGLARRTLINAVIGEVRYYFTHYKSTPHSM